MIEMGTLFILFLIGTAMVTSSSSGSFSPKKYELRITPNFQEKTFTAKTTIHVNVTGSVREFDLLASKDLDIERVSFFQAEHIFRGNPQLIGHTANIKFNEETQLLHVTLLNDVTAESIKEEGYIEVDYQGKVGALGSGKGLFELRNNLFETNIKDDASRLFPLLGDSLALVNLSVITPYRGSVQTELKATEHKDVPGGELFSNNYSSGDEKIKISNVHFKVEGPTALILD